jgi:hypothetical protein
VSEDIAIAPKKRGRPKKQVIDAVVTPVREICQWCSAVITAGRNPPQLGTCAKCQIIENTYEAEEPCEYCGGRKAPSVAGVTLRNGHRASCRTLAEDPTPRRKLTDEDVAEIRHRLGPAPVEF